MLYLYWLSLRLYGLAIFLASPFRSKAKLFLRGRRGWLNKMPDWSEEKVAWFHCSSLGEFEQARPLLESFAKVFPDRKIALTFFSPSGYEVRKNYQFADWVGYLPIDSRGNAIKFIRKLNPEIAFFAKYDFWYFYLTQLRRRHIPSILFSATFRADQVFFKKQAGLWKEMLRTFTMIFVQDKKSEELLSQISIDRVKQAGDSRADRVIEIAERVVSYPIIEAFAKNAKVGIIGSAWEADTDVVLPVWRRSNKEFKLIIAPHNLDDEYMEVLIDKCGGKGKAVKYTKATKESASEAQVLILDTMGMLNEIYRYGTWAYVGGGFGAGIHNTLEAAVYGMPVVFGPKYHKFPEALALIKAGAAMTVDSAASFQEKFAFTLLDERKVQLVGAQARRYVWESGGATGKILDYCKGILPGAPLSFLSADAPMVINRVVSAVPENQEVVAEALNSNIKIEEEKPIVATKVESVDAVVEDESVNHAASINEVNMVAAEVVELVAVEVEESVKSKKAQTSRKEEANSGETRKLSVEEIFNKVSTQKVEVAESTEVLGGIDTNLEAKKDDQTDVEDESQEVEEIVSVTEVLVLHHEVVVETETQELHVVESKEEIAATQEIKEELIEEKQVVASILPENLGQSLHRRVSYNGIVYLLVEDTDAESYLNSIYPYEQLIQINDTDFLPEPIDESTLVFEVKWEPVAFTYLFDENEDKPWNNEEPFIDLALIDKVINIQSEDYIDEMNQEWQPVNRAHAPTQELSVQDEEAYAVKPIRIEAMSKAISARFGSRTSTVKSIEIEAMSEAISARFGSRLSTAKSIETEAMSKAISARFGSRIKTAGKVVLKEEQISGKDEDGRSEVLVWEEGINSELIELIADFNKPVAQDLEEELIVQTARTESKSRLNGSARNGKVNNYNDVKKKNDVRPQVYTPLADEDVDLHDEGNEG